MGTPSLSELVRQFADVAETWQHLFDLADAEVQRLRGEVPGVFTWRGISIRVSAPQQVLLRLLSLAPLPIGTVLVALWPDFSLENRTKILNRYNSLRGRLQLKLDAAGIGLIIWREDNHLSLRTVACADSQ